MVSAASLRFPLGWGHMPNDHMLLQYSSVIINRNMLLISLPKDPDKPIKMPSFHTLLNFNFRLFVEITSDVFVN